MYRPLFPRGRKSSDEVSLVVVEFWGGAKYDVPDVKFRELRERKETSNTFLWVAFTVWVYV